MELSIYIAMTLLGLLAKLWGFTVIKKTWKQNLLYILTGAFTLFLILQSFFEMYQYIFAFRADSESAHRGMIGYYVCSFIAICIIPFLILSLVRKAIPKIFTLFILCLNSIVIVLLIFSDLIISGVRPLGITFTAIKGDFYWLFQMSVIFSVFFTVFHLAKTIPDKFLQIRTRNLLIAFLPCGFFIILIIALMQAGLEINAIGFLPISTCIFLGAIINNICSKEIVDYSYWIPFSKKRREINKLIKPFIEIQSDGLDPELKKEYNKILTQHALELFDGNQTKAAEWLKVSQSWVSRNNKNS